MIISAEFAYIFWLKSHVKVSVSFASAAAICLVMIIFYYWVGGPDHAVRVFNDLIYFSKSY